LIVCFPVSRFGPVSMIPGGPRARSTHIRSPLTSWRCTNYPARSTGARGSRRRDHSLPRLFGKAVIWGRFKLAWIVGRLIRPLGMGRLCCGPAPLRSGGLHEGAVDDDAAGLHISRGAIGGASWALIGWHASVRHVALDTILKPTAQFSGLVEANHSHNRAGWIVVVAAMNLPVWTRLVRDRPIPLCQGDVSTNWRRLLLSSVSKVRSRRFSIEGLRGELRTAVLRLRQHRRRHRGSSLAGEQSDPAPL